MVPLTRQAATQGSKQFEVKNCQQTLIFVNIFFVILSHICFKIFVPQRRRTKKFYLALLRGHVKEDRVDIDIPIGEEAAVMSIVNFNLQNVFFLQMNYISVLDCDIHFLQMNYLY